MLGNHHIEFVQDSSLVPGDKIIIQESMILPCDAVLISGKVIVDESMLTGESIPVSKVPIDIGGLGGDTLNPLQMGSTVGIVRPAAEVDLALHRSGSVLFGGTRVRACYGDQCVAVCYRTSFRSSKGQLVASLLKPKEGFITFITDALWVLLLMFILSTALYAGVATNLVKMGLDAGQVVLHYLDAVTIAVPPAMTACLTVATAIAIGRLKVREIFVTDTSRVNFAGVISAACFDKTGTLTENSLQFLGAICTSSILGNSGGDILVDKEAMEDFSFEDGNPLPPICQQVMATCHSLSVLGAGDQEPSGDPLEVELLRACRWTLRTVAQRAGHLVAVAPDSKTGGGRCYIIKHFEFTPDRLRAATVMKEESTGRLRYLVKGSPEVIVRMCVPSSVPTNIFKELSSLARKGYRVIAMAYRDCCEEEDRISSMNQDDLEALGDIQFAGLLYLSSALKQDTIRTMQALKSARIHTNMITGDHIHTAIAIAGQCHLVHSHELSESWHKTRKSASQLTKSVHHLLYIIEEDQHTGQTVIVDHATDQVVQLSLADVLALAAQSLYRSVSKTPLGKQGISSLSALQQTSGPATSIDSIENPLFSTSPSTAAPLASAQNASGSNRDAVSSRPSIVELAITGQGLQSLKRNYGAGVVRAVVRFAKIFARMKPYDKKFVVETLSQIKEFEPLDLTHRHEEARVTTQPKASFSIATKLRQFLVTYTSLNLGGAYTEGDELAKLDTISKFEVLFCGDGANDMIALRAATVGVSLCDAETSVAAPITSKQQTPASVIEVLKQGRCSLVTAYVLILFNIMYGVIQLFMACELYAYGLKAGDYMYLMQDLFYTLVLGLAISYSEPSASLSSTLPPQRFLSPYFITKLFLQLATFISFQAIALWALSTQNFYDRYETDDPLGSSYAQEATVANDMALAQLMIASIVSSIGEPFRLVWVKNWYHWAALAGQITWLSVQIFIQDSYFFKHILQIKPVPVSFGGILVAIMVVNLIVCVALNTLVDTLFLAKANQRWYEKVTPLMVKRFYHILSEEEPNSSSEQLVSPGKTDNKPLLK
eukprot:scaffold6925_cov248-Ochromonas_danica.AAC.13